MIFDIYTYIFIIKQFRVKVICLLLLAKNIVYVIVNFHKHVIFLYHNKIFFYIIFSVYCFTVFTRTIKVQIYNTFVRTIAGAAYNNFIL